MSERAEGVRVACPLFQAEGGGSTPTSALQLLVVEVSTEVARKLNAKWHSRLPKYASGFLLYSTISFGFVFDGEFYGTAIWTQPVARLLPQDSWLELRRLALAPDAPKNTASRMLAVMARLIKTKFPRIVRLVSYQDAEVHTGTIYKAAGWTACHTHAGGSWDRPHAKNQDGTARTRPDANQATGPKVRWELSLEATP